MSMYFDRSGNAYQIDDESIINRKSKITLTNTRGEEFEIDASKGDEYRLTPEEHQRAIEELQQQIRTLGKFLGSCPVIDPPPASGPGSGLGGIKPGGKPGGSCPNIDPVNIDTVLGTQSTFLERDLMNMLRNLLGSCPNIDPVRIGSIIGSLVERELKMGNR